MTDLDLNQMFLNFIGLIFIQLSFNIQIELLIQHAKTKYKFSTFQNSLLQTSSLYTVCCCPTNCYTNKLYW